MQAISGINGFLYLAIKLLQFNSISLTGFKNYEQRSFRFNSRIVGISGANGVGKTNLLDAIYYLCFTKGYFSRLDSVNVHNGSPGFRIEGRVTKDGEPHHIVCILRETGRKEFLLDEEAYDRFAKHVGRFPCVFVAPDDVQIITEGSEERRRFMDALISQIDAEYLQHLISYNKLIVQRNSYLKSVADARYSNTELLDVYDSQLVTDGTYIFERRKTFLNDCFLRVGEFYEKISGTREKVDLMYESQLTGNDFAALLAVNRSRDIYLQRTSVGIHRDDLAITLNQQPFRNIASQGQRKCLLFALKLAEFSILKERKQSAPLLLLDDVFEKLDAGRMHNLLAWVCVENDGQVFITDTHKSRIAEHLDVLGAEYEIQEIE